MGRLYSCLLLLLLYLISCSRSNSPGIGGDGNQAEASYEVKFVILSSGVTSIGGKSFTFDLLKISDNIGTVAYAQWIYQNNTEARPTILAMDPYTGISWTNEVIDLGWASYPNAHLGYIREDINGPGFVSGQSKTINYILKTPEVNASQVAYYLLNNFNALILNGRFYAGGDLENEKAEVKAALNFLKNSNLVKSTSVGILGMSWGGFEALHGAVFGKDILSPKVGVAISPLSDFADQLKYIKSDIPFLVVNSSVEQSYLDFFDAYLRRIFSSTKTYDWNNDYLKKYNKTYLSDNMMTNFLIIHDDWDTLVPVRQTRNLIESNPNKFQGFYYQHKEGINYETFQRDHSQSSEGMSFKGFDPFVQLYLKTNLMDFSEEKIIYYNNTDFTKSVVAFRKNQNDGLNISFLKNRFLDFCKPNVFFYDLDSGLRVTGPYLLSILTTAWGWSKSENAVCSYLESQSL